MWLDLDKGASANRKPRAGGFQPFGGDRYRLGEQRSAVRCTFDGTANDQKDETVCLFIYLSGDGHQQLRRTCPSFAA